MLSHLLRSRFPISLTQTLLRRPKTLIKFPQTKAQGKSFSTTKVLRTQILEDRGHDHSGIWKLERYVSWMLVLTIPATIIYCDPILDNVLALLIACHSHWGLEAICKDYIRPNLFPMVVCKTGLMITYSLSATVFAGLFYYNYNDEGLCKTIKQFWALHHNDNPPKDDKKKAKPKKKKNGDKKCDPPKKTALILDDVQE